MTSYRYRLLNVFAIEGRSFSGNPLCVFEDARGMDEATMQALALQFNLSETTFILPSDNATARVRIFTPSFEMPFAGHPTLGTAQVVRDLHNTGDQLTLEMRAGIIPVTANKDTWTLQANPPTWRDVAASNAQLAQMLGLKPDDIVASPLWVNTGSDQLIVPLASADAVQRATPDLTLLKQYARLNDQRFLVYVWSSKTSSSIESRFFFAKGTSVAEDPATGSACANLGGWFIATGARMPIELQIFQGGLIKQPSRLGLQVDVQSRILVSGHVLDMGSGVIHL
jgi:PhzF family phenazine biosynthesis protein